MCLSSETVAAIGGAAFGAWFAYLFGVRMARIQRLTDIRFKLRRTFLPLWRKVKEMPPTEFKCGDFLRGTYPEQEEVAEEFMFFCGCVERRRFRKAWEDYHCQKEWGVENLDGGSLSYYDGGAMHIVGQPPENRNKLAEKRLHNILAFTEPK